MPGGIRLSRLFGAAATALRLHGAALARHKLAELVHFQEQPLVILVRAGIPQCDLDRDRCESPHGIYPHIISSELGGSTVRGKVHPPPLLPHTMVRLQADLLGREGRRGHIATGFLGSGLIDQSQPAPDRIAAVSRDRIAAEARIYVLQSIRAENCRRPVRMSRRPKL